MRKVVMLLMSVLLLSGTLVSNTSCKAKKRLTGEQKSHLKSAYQELKREIPEAQVTHEKDNVKLVFPEAILFEVNDTQVNPSYIPTLAKIAKVLNKYPGTSVLISGYTDTSGGDELNKKLSWGRAESAKAALLSNEVKNKRVYTWGFGSKNPIASNATVEGRKQNRRVEFVILYNYQEEQREK